MTATMTPRARPPHRLPEWIALFWVFSYAALTARAYLVYGEAWQPLNAMRLIAISAGAALFGGVLIAQRRWRGDRRALVSATAALPAALAVLAVRALYHRLVDPAVPLEEDLRWILVWAGYFGLWVATFVATERTSAVQHVAIGAVEQGGVDDAIDALADVIRTAPAASRATIVARLDAARGYDVADAALPDAGRDIARRGIIDALLARLVR